MNKIFLYLYGMLTLLTSCDKSKDINILRIIVSNDYSGYIVIFFDDIYNDSDMSYNSGIHCVNIPRNGIVHSNLKLNSVITEEVFSVDGLKIEALTSNSNKEKKYVGANSRRGYYVLDDGIIRTYLLIDIGTKEELLHLKHLDSNDILEIYAGRKSGKDYLKANSKTN